MAKDWYVYIIKATDGRLYTGVTVDISRRWAEHSGTSGKKDRGAKFFRGRKPESLEFLKVSESRSTASKEESAIKKLKRAQKMKLISSEKNQLCQYSELLHFGEH